MKPTVHLFADVLGPYGGIETYLDALARRLHAESWDVRVAVSCNAPAPFLDDLVVLGVPVYRQPFVPGDRWSIRQRCLVRRLARDLAPGDWVYCVRQPMPRVYLSLVRSAHRRGARVAASWSLAPEFIRPPEGRIGSAFVAAVRETDAVISVSACTASQFEGVYGYAGPVHVVRYHNRETFRAPVPLHKGPPFALGFLGRIDIRQKNLDTIIEAFGIVARRRSDVELNLHGGGPDLDEVRGLVSRAGLDRRVTVHGVYDHSKDLARIVERNHAFVYTSRFEGGPCFSLVELLQAGRYVVASPVGGIPDVYAGRPEAGELVRQDDVEDVARGLERAVERIAAGTIDPTRIRAIYDGHFSESVAHRQFLAALALDEAAPKRMGLQV